MTLVMVHHCVVHAVIQRGGVIIDAGQLISGKHTSKANCHVSLCTYLLTFNLASMYAACILQVQVNLTDNMYARTF